MKIKSNAAVDFTCKVILVKILLNIAELRPKFIVS